ncbi:50S ribosomal protein L19e [Candidatus Woesearchaeota archaeon]|nr:50S ribosomal protein L19e [Candidatus Woesearchaeota archaeon]
MMLKLQKRLASIILHCSPKRIVFDPARLEDIKEAITKTDIRLLIGEGVISRRQEVGVSRVRANKRKRQKSKGLRRGEGSRKGKATARLPKKEKWINSIRAQRKFLKYLKHNSLITQKAFKELYLKSKGGFFRSIKHIKLYLNEHNLIIGISKTNKEAKIRKQSKPEEKIRNIRKNTSNVSDQ